MPESAARAPADEALAAGARARDMDDLDWLRAIAMEIAEAPCRRVAELGWPHGRGGR
jgi:hypothetical protein